MSYDELCNPVKMGGSIMKFGGEEIEQRKNWSGGSAEVPEKVAMVSHTLNPNYVVRPHGTAFRFAEAINLKGSLTRARKMHYALSIYPSRHSQISGDQKTSPIPSP